jgi:predicted transcriptional regulator
MARKSRNHHFDLPPLELQCMSALWAAGQATVHEIRAELMPTRPLAYTTIMTVMDRLARKGVVEREKRGRAHLYRPAVSQEAVSERALKQLVERFFNGSYEALLRHLENGGRGASIRIAVGARKPEKSSKAEPAAHPEHKADSPLDTSLL